MSGYSRYRQHSQTASSSRSRIGRGGGGGSFSAIPPALKAALVVWVFEGAIAILNTVTAGTSIIFCTPVQWLLYVLTGALAAHLALGAGYDRSRLAVTGAQAGFFGWILPAIFYLVISILGIPIGGVGLLGVAAWLICGPLNLGLYVAFGALGAWLYGNYAG